jgi:hypothetical protein
MKPRWLRLLLFIVLLLAVVFVLRLTLHTVPGLIGVAGVCVIRLLYFLYRSMQALITVLWEVSAVIAERIQESRVPGASEKESPHATRLF